MTQTYNSEVSNKWTLLGIVIVGLALTWTLVVLALGSDWKAKESTFAMTYYPKITVTGDIVGKYRTEDNRYLELKTADGKYEKIGPVSLETFHEHDVGSEITLKTQNENNAPSRNFVTLSTIALVFFSMMIGFRTIMPVLGIASLAWVSPVVFLTTMFWFTFDAIAYRQAKIARAKLSFLISRRESGKVFMLSGRYDGKNYFFKKLYVRNSTIYECEMDASVDVLKGR